jgi:hypothetical protein
MSDGFEVSEAYDVQDLTDVKQESNLLPATKGLKVRVAKAKQQANKDNDIYSLKLELRIVDGIPNADGVPQYVNKPMFTGIMDLVYGAKLDIKDRSNNKWWKAKQHLVEFKKFCQAMDISLSSIVINDEFFSNLIGREVLVDVVHEAKTITDAEGKKVKTGEFQEKLKNWAKVS